MYNCAVHLQICFQLYEAITKPTRYFIHYTVFFFFTAPYLDRVIMHTSNLRFSKMTRNDNGVYDCEVSGNGQFGETRVTVTVLGKRSAYILTRKSV